MGRIKQIDGMRYIMTFVVLVSHFQFLADSKWGRIYTNNLKNGGLAVDFFFIVSGFCLYCSSFGKDDRCQPIEFAIKHIKKIYPAYIVSLFIGAIYASIVYSKKYGIFTFFRVTFDFAMCSSLLQSITGMTQFSHALNQPCWFLSTLFICYFFCPLLLKVVKKFKSPKQTYFGLVVTLILIFALLSIATAIDGKMLGGRINDLHYGHPIIRICYILFGMFLAQYWILGKRHFKYHSVSEYLSVIAFLFYFFTRNTYPLSDDVLRVLNILAISCTLISVLNGSGIFSRFLSQERIIDLSLTCMYLYVFHYPIRDLVVYIFGNLNFINVLGELSYLLEIFLIVCLTMAVKKLYIHFSSNFDAVINKHLLNKIYGRLLSNEQ